MMNKNLSTEQVNILEKCHEVFPFIEDTDVVDFVKSVEDYESFEVDPREANRKLVNEDNLKRFGINKYCAQIASCGIDKTDKTNAADFKTKQRMAMLGALSREISNGEIARDYFRENGALFNKDFEENDLYTKVRPILR